MNKLLTILVGLLFLLVPIYIWIINLLGAGDAALIFLKGGVIWILIFVGLILLISGLSDLTSN